jgi:hypothetical protein
MSGRLRSAGGAAIRRGLPGKPVTALVARIASATYVAIASTLAPLPHVTPVTSQ